MSEGNAKQSIKWTALEYNYTPKNSNWFWLVASGALVLIIVSVIMRNFLFGVFVGLAVFVIILSSSKKPRKLIFSIESRGIKIGNNYYPYSELNSFWINYDPPEKKELILKTKKKLANFIKIPLANTDPNLVRDFLLKMLKEKRYDESLTETITEKLGF